MDFQREYMAACKADPDNERAGLSILFAKFLYEKQEEELSKKREIFWITINPKPDIDYIEFRDLLTRLMGRVFMKGAIFAFEQRAKSKPYSGFHAHILVDKIMSPKQMLDRVYNTVKGCVGNIKAVDLRSYPYSYREDKLDYLSGKKWEISKDPVVEATHKWRGENGIEEFYMA